jgi:plastocyanin domain-containing protein
MTVRWAIGVGCILGALALGLVRPAAADQGDIVITIKGGKFVPREIPVPAGQKLKIVVRNQDPTTSEFESTDFHREKIVRSGGEITVFVGPLDAGTYEFFDDFHPKDRGHLVVK